MNYKIFSHFAGTLIVVLASFSFDLSEWQSKFIHIKEDKLVYVPDEKGNTIPDFSRVGYYQGDKPIPDVKVIKTITPDGKDDDRLLIQTAIDEVASLPAGKDGFRGAILLKKGTYKIYGTVNISAGGIVIRGEGNSEKRTLVTAAGKGQRSLFRISGTNNRTEIENTRTKISDSYVASGSFSFTVENPGCFKAGDNVVIFRPGTDAWIKDLQMDKIVPRQGTRQWRAKEYNLHFERTITRIEGNRVFVDIPVVMPMEDKYGGGYVYKYSFDGRISEVGIENIFFRSEYASDTDEDHSWIAIDFESVQNCWARNITSRYFAYSCVFIGENGKFITVSNSECLDAKSLITGGRRYSFNVNGQMCLVENCLATDGRHDYVTGARVCGPNVFYNCKAIRTHADIGPHHRWAVGTLYDNIETDGQINVQDRGNYGSGHGWAGAVQVLWNCKASETCVQSPWVSAKNYCIGETGRKSSGRFSDRPDGEWEGLNKQGLQPESLYQAQLRARKFRK